MLRFGTASLIASVTYRIAFQAATFHTTKLSMGAKDAEFWILSAEKPHLPKHCSLTYASV